MKPIWRFVSAGLLLAGLGGPVFANDSSAVLGAGGLELVTSPDIVMAREDLFLSPGAVRVNYEFRNESARDITTRIAFPLPELGLVPEQNVALPSPDEENFVNFRVKVDGQPVATALEQRAMTEDGRDVSALLTRLGVPLNARLPGWEEKVRALPDAAWRELVASGLLDGATDPAKRPDYFIPLWSLKATFHWEQTFPAGKTLKVEHSYQPVVGYSFISQGDGVLEELEGPYCLDAAGRAGLKRRLEEQKRRVVNEEGNMPILIVRQVEYVLTTGANWNGPIGQFRLTLDKEKPRSILSLCAEGVKKTGPTTFVVERSNFTPKDEIRFVIFGE